MIKPYEFISTSLKLLKSKNPTPGYYIFTFHQVGNKLDGIVDKGTNSSVKEFVEKIELIQENFKIISMDDFLKIKKTRLSEAYAILTFDDGDKSCENEVFGILVDKQIPATFFINSYTYLNNKFSWPFILRFLKNTNLIEYNSLLKDSNIQNLRLGSSPSAYTKAVNRIYNADVDHKSCRDYFVSRKFLENLDKAQFTIGNHGHEHHRYSMLDYEAQKRDFLVAKEFLSSFESYLNIFALPFGRTYDFNANTISLVKEQNTFLFTSMGGNNGTIFISMNRIPSDNMSYELLSNKFF